MQSGQKSEEAVASSVSMVVTPLCHLVYIATTDRYIAKDLIVEISQLLL